VVSLTAERPFFIRNDAGHAVCEMSTLSDRPMMFDEQFENCKGVVLFLRHCQVKFDRAVGREDDESGELVALTESDASDTARYIYSVHFA